MKEIGTQELKEIQLSILKRIDSFCRDNNIQYSLAFGSLLGAIRHKGYIPWDDDLDIMIPRREYDIFVKSFCDENYRIIDLSNDVEYELPFAKVYDTRTIMEEYAETRMNFGVNIDVFPLDYAPNNKLELFVFLLRKQIWNTIHLLKFLKVSKTRSFFKNFLIKVFHCILSPLSIRKTSERMDSLSRLYNSKQGNLMGIIAPADNRKKELFSAFVFTQFIRMPFEGIQVMVIRNYDEYLRGTFGNYMQLPPIEKRVSHHSFKAWWKE